MEIAQKFLNFYKQTIKTVVPVLGDGHYKYGMKTTLLSICMKMY